MINRGSDYHELATIVEQTTRNITEKWQSRNDNGWHSYDPTQKSDVWTTAGVVLWLLRADANKYQSSIERGLRFLTETQHVEANGGREPPDGGWGYRLDQRSDSTATALSLLAFVSYARLKVGRTSAHVKQMRPACDWLIKNMSGDGGFCSIPESGRPLAYNTCWGSIALSECRTIPELETPVINGHLARTLQFVLKSKHSNGWGTVIGDSPDPIGTAYCMYLLQRMQESGLLTRERLEDEVNRGQWLRNNQSSNGSWDVGPMQSPVEATAWAIITLLASHDDPEAPRIRSAVKYLRDSYVPDQGWPAVPGQQPLIWVTCYVCSALTAYIDTVRQVRTPLDGIRPSKLGKKVFIVHGHDEFIRKETRDLIESLGLQPVVLEEQPNLGKTLTEKFEHYAGQDGVDYAVILCTSDDMVPSEGVMRPRPNVLFELGWFSAKLTRERICLACDGEVSLPSDFSGVMFINLKKKNWKEAITQELKAVGLIS